MEATTRESAIAQAAETRVLGRSLSTWLVAGVAIALGAAMIFAIGFSSSDFLHGAAHDVRHASGFPCH